MVVVVILAISLALAMGAEEATTINTKSGKNSTYGGLSSTECDIYRSSHFVDDLMLSMLVFHTKQKALFDDEVPSADSPLNTTNSHHNSELTLDPDIVYDDTYYDFNILDNISYFE